jgi:hypothetical protein
MSAMAGLTQSQGKSIPILSEPAMDTFAVNQDSVQIGLGVKLAPSGAVLRQKFGFPGAR